MYTVNLLKWGSGGSKLLSGPGDQDQRRDLRTASSAPRWVDRDPGSPWSHPVLGGRGERGGGGQAASPPASPSPYPGLWALVSPGPLGTLGSVFHTLLTPPSVDEEASGHRGERSKAETPGPRKEGT